VYTSQESALRTQPGALRADAHHLRDAACNAINA